MLIPVLLFIVGLLCLIKGGDWFVDGATGIARRFHVPELLIGATVVSIGTTLPEVMVSTTSALTGHGEIAYGNAIGSIICNASLIAALTIAVKPGKVDPKSLRTPVLFFFVAAAFYAGVAYTTGYFSRPVGLILLAMFAAYIICNVMAMKNAPAPEEEEEPEENASFAKELGLLAVGAVLIAVGANLLVDNGTLIAQALGVPESVIALTFVALGTSLPELVTAITSLAKGHGALSLGGGTLYHSAELHALWPQCIAGAGVPGHVRRDAAAHPARPLQGQAEPPAGHCAAVHLRGILCGAVHHLIKQQKADAALRRPFAVLRVTFSNGNPSRKR